MPDEPRAAASPEPLNAAVTGSVGGRELSGRFRVALREHALYLDPADGNQGGGTRALNVAVRSVAGARLSAGVFELHLDSGDRLTFSGDDRLSELVVRLEQEVFAVGEVMRSSRAAGSRRAYPGEDHDRFFAPFLQARLRLEQAPDAGGKLEAVSANEIRASILGVLDSFSSERFHNEPADRRALLAELEEYVEPLLGALDRLDATSAAARRASPERAYAEWRVWRDALVDCFVEAERAWMRTAPVLREFPKPDPEERPSVSRWKVRR